LTTNEVNGLKKDKMGYLLPTVLEVFMAVLDKSQFYCWEGRLGQHRGFHVVTTMCDGHVAGNAW